MDPEEAQAFADLLNERNALVAQVNQLRAEIAELRVELEPQYRSHQKQKSKLLDTAGVTLTWLTLPLWVVGAVVVGGGFVAAQLVDNALRRITRR